MKFRVLVPAVSPLAHAYQVTPLLRTSINGAMPGAASARNLSGISPGKMTMGVLNVVTEFERDLTGSRAGLARTRAQAAGSLLRI